MMSPFIARMIMQATDESLEAGKAKYEAYFVNTRLYKNWRSEVDSILNIEGYEAVISDR